MAIIHFSFDHCIDDYPQGAYCPLVSQWNTEGRHIILWETHKGLCLSDREYNGRDDSDFYMLVWNPEKKETQSIEFASTRGWSYPSYGSYVDATPEVIEEYKAWQTAKDREIRIKRRWYRRQEQIKIAQQCGVTRKQISKLCSALNQNDFKAVLGLLKTKKFRSEFRKSLADQVRIWVKAENPSYRMPLSRKQLSYL